MTPFLQPGEQLHQVIAAQTASPGWAALGGVVLLLTMNRYRMVAVTSQRILVLDCGKFGFKKARAVVTELPRATRLGPAKGLWFPVQLAGEKLWVHRRFHKDIAAADGAPSVG